MDAQQIETAMTNIATRVKGVKIGRFEFDEDFHASTGRFVFSSKGPSVEIEICKGNTMLNLAPSVLVGSLKLNVNDWSVSDIELKVKDEEELYDLVMATVRGITKALR